MVYICNRIRRKRRNKLRYGKSRVRNLGILNKEKVIRVVVGMTVSSLRRSWENSVLILRLVDLGFIYTPKHYVLPIYELSFESKVSGFICFYPVFDVNELTYMISTISGVKAHMET